MDRTDIINELHELLYLTASKFVRDNNLSIQSIYFDVDEMVIVENTNDDTNYLFNKTYRFNNKYLNEEYNG